MTREKRVEILGVGIDRVTMAEALARGAQWLAGSQPRLVFTPNAEIVMQAQENPALRTALAGADLIVPDGMGVVWASRRLGNPLPERVAGFDLALGLLAEAERQGKRVYLLGARPEVVAAAAAAVQARYPGLTLAGYHDGYFAAVEEEAVVAAIRAARPDLLLVGLGAPKQELWLTRWREELGVPLAIGVGGTLDVLAGKVKRAPAWLGRLGLEWAWRLLREPRRWRRMLALPRFALRVLTAEAGIRRGFRQ